MPHNTRAARIASGQLGLIASRQARGAGMTDDEIDRMVRRGDWERRHASVFRMSGTPTSWRQDVLAACLAIDGPVAASHRAAAQLWGLIDNVDVVELTVPRTKGPTPAGTIVHRLCDFRPQDMTIRHGVPATNPLRTVLDLGAVAPELVRHAVDVGTSRRLITVTGLRVITDEVGRKGRAGVGALRAVLEDRGVGMTESVLEGMFRRALRRCGVRLPIEQYEVRDAGKFVARVDFADPDLRLAWEVLGYEFHSTYEALQHDEARRKALQRIGWEVNGVYRAQLVGDPDSVAREVVEARRRRSAAILGGKTGT